MTCNDKYELSHSFRGHAGVIRALVSRGPYVFSAGSDCSIKVWDIKDKDMRNSRGCVKTLSGHTADVSVMLCRVYT